MSGICNSFFLSVPLTPFATYHTLLYLHLPHFLISSKSREHMKNPCPNILLVVSRAVGPEVPTLRGWEFMSLSYQAITMNSVNAFFSIAGLFYLYRNRDHFLVTDNLKQWLCFVKSHQEYEKNAFEYLHSSKHRLWFSLSGFKCPIILISYVNLAISDWRHIFIANTT